MELLKRELIQEVQYSIEFEKEGENLVSLSSLLSLEIGWVQSDGTIA